MKYIKIFINQYKSRASFILFFWWLGLRLIKALRIGFKCRNCDTKKIDIVIPTISKDFEALNLLVQSLKFVKNEINKIYIVAPRGIYIENFCILNNLNFIDETFVLGFSKDYIKYKVSGIDRSGWLFQQLIKLSGDQFVEMDDYLVVDSDTIFVNSCCFMCGKKYIFYASEEWHEPYFKSFKNLFGYSAPTKLSLTSHMMIFNKNLIREMKLEMEATNQRIWYDEYIASSSNVEKSCISDYETYANWVIYNHGKRALIRPSYNRNVHKQDFTSLENLCKKYRLQHSISFHSYLDAQ